MTDEQRLKLSADENTLVIANAARLLKDAKLLADLSRFASAFSLAVLGIEEIGKVILEVWGRAKPLRTANTRRNSHVRKQAAVGSLMLATFAVREFAEKVSDGDGSDELVKQASAAFGNSEEGKFLWHVSIRALEQTKHVGLYRDAWLTASGLHADQFDATDVTSIFETARRVMEGFGDPRCMRVGRAIYESH